MKRTCLISSALALTVLTPGVASAEPGILFVPTEEITLLPDNDPACSGIGSPNSAFNCTAVVEAATMVPPYADTDTLITDLQTSLAAYDVMITTERPVEYLPYTMLLPEVDVETFSLACSFGGINCGSRKRNGIIFLVPSTDNCMDPEIVQQTLYAFGRISGLEGVANPMDVMNFPPDFTMPVTEFLDDCSDRAHQQNFDDMGMPTGDAQLECTSKDHTSMCPDDAAGDPGQNSHQDMLAYYGPLTEDSDPPVISNVLPADGTVLMTGDNGVAMLEIDAEIMDADPAVGARWTIMSDALPEEMFPGNMLTICTNDVCTVNWDDVAPAKATDSDWASPVDLNLPPGEYAITFEAADYHGNVAEMVSFSVTIEGEPPGASTGNVDDTAGPMETSNDDNNDSSQFTTGQGSSEDDDDSGSGASDDSGGGGCSCRTTEAPGGMVLMLLGFVGLGVMRRRW